MTYPFLFRVSRGRLTKGLRGSKERIIRCMRIQQNSSIEGGGGGITTETRPKYVSRTTSLACCQEKIDDLSSVYPEQSLFCFEGKFYSTTFLARCLKKGDNGIEISLNICYCIRNDPFLIFCISFLPKSLTEKADLSWLTPTKPSTYTKDGSFQTHQLYRDCPSITWTIAIHECDDIRGVNGLICSFCHF